jgi:hypothetical protein
MKLEIQKTFKIGDKEFTSKNEALKSIAMETLSKILEGGVDSVIENSTDFVSALKVVSTQKAPVFKGGSGTLKSLNELLNEDGHSVVRDGGDWPVYHLTLADGSNHTIRYTGKVWELYNLFVDGGVPALLKYKTR